MPAYDLLPQSEQRLYAPDRLTAHRSHEERAYWYGVTGEVDRVRGRYWWELEFTVPSAECPSLQAVVVDETGLMRGRVVDMRAEPWGVALVRVVIDDPPTTGGNNSGRWGFRASGPVRARVRSSRPFTVTASPARTVSTWLPWPIESTPGTAAPAEIDAIAGMLEQAHAAILATLPAPSDSRPRDEQRFAQLELDDQAATHEEPPASERFGMLELE